MTSRKKCDINYKIIDEIFSVNDCSDLIIFTGTNNIYYIANAIQSTFNTTRSTTNNIRSARNNIHSIFNRHLLGTYGYQLIMQSFFDRLRLRIDIELFVDVTDMRFGCLQRDIQLFRYFRVRFTQGHKL